MKILITNIVALNGGDAAILYGMVKSLRKAFGAIADIRIYASEPEVCQSLYPEFIFRETLGLSANRAPFSKIRILGRVFRTLQRYRYLTAARLYGNGMKMAAYLLPAKARTSLMDYATADYIVSSGGTYLIEPYGLVTQYTDYCISNYLGKKVSFYTQSMGPFIEPRNVKWMQKVFSKADCILVRDQKSMENVKALQVVPEPYVVKVADAAFSLMQPEVFNRAVARTLPKGKLKIAFSVREWQVFHHQSKERGMLAYRISIATLVKFLVGQGHEVSFLSTCQGVEAYTDDSDEADEILRLLPAKVVAKVHVQYEFLHFTDLMTRLQQMDLIVATRLHMSILSLISGTPVLPIAYEFKTQELFTTLGMQDYLMSMDTLTPDIIMQKYQMFLQNIDSMRSDLFDKVRFLSYDAMFSANYIKNTKK